MNIHLKDLKFSQRIEQGIFIRPLGLEDDISLYRQLCQDYHYLLPWCPWMEDLNHLEDVQIFLSFYDQQLKQDQYFRLGIYHHNQIIGWVSAFDFDWSKKSYFLGYWIASSYQKRGYVTYTVKFMMSLLLKVFKLKTTYILCRHNNFPSQSLIAKLAANRISSSVENILAYEIIHKTTI